MVAGVDHKPQPMSAVELSTMTDPMAMLLRAGIFPMTVTDLLGALHDASTGDGAAARADVIQNVYLVSESGQIPQEVAPNLHRDLRYAIVCNIRSRKPDLMISTGANVDPADAFLQVLAWDESARVFNYYMRIKPAWVWVGNSWSALAPPSRGKGCFDSHINGSAVMKELKQPWLNWQSEAAIIQLAPDDPLHSSRLYQRVAPASQLELTVRELIARWTAARLAKVTEGGVVQNPDHLLRHLFTTTTVNLASSFTESAAVSADGEDVVLPFGFWLNPEALGDLGLLPPVAPPAVSSQHYLQSLTAFEFRIQETVSGFSQPGDTFFAFVVPEAAHEDNEVVRQLLANSIITPRFAACALMVDFANPVFSPAREALMRYVPTEPTPTHLLCSEVADRIVSAAEDLDPDSAEGQFAANWRLGDAGWSAAFLQRVGAYLDAVRARLTTATGFFDYVRLAESRRRDFKKMKLNEFELTLPATNIPTTDPSLQMNNDATIGTRPEKPATIRETR